MIEPTETESVASLDRLVETMLRIADEVDNDPELLRTAPHCTPVRRIDEAAAARELNISHSD
jgi:glycine dehydrogenase subunit 2